MNTNYLRAILIGIALPSCARSMHDTGSLSNFCKELNDHKARESTFRKQHPLIQKLLTMNAHTISEKKALKSAIHKKPLPLQTRKKIDSSIIRKNLEIAEKAYGEKNYQRAFAYTHDIIKTAMLTHIDETSKAYTYKLLGHICLQTNEYEASLDQFCKSLDCYSPQRLSPDTPQRAAYLETLFLTIRVRRILALQYFRVDRDKFEALNYVFLLVDDLLTARKDALSIDENHTRKQEASVEAHKIDLLLANTVVPFLQNAAVDVNGIKYVDDKTFESVQVAVEKIYNAICQGQKEEDTSVNE